MRASLRGPSGGRSETTPFRGTHAVARCFRLATARVRRMCHCQRVFTARGNLLSSNAASGTWCQGMLSKRWRWGRESHRRLPRTVHRTVLAMTHIHIFSFSASGGIQPASSPLRGSMPIRCGDLAGQKHSLIQRLVQSRLPAKSGHSPRWRPHHFKYTTRRIRSDPWLSRARKR